MHVRTHNCRTQGEMACCAPPRDGESPMTNDTLTNDSTLVSPAASENTVFVVTGGNKGIGFNIVRRLCESNAGMME